MIGMNIKHLRKKHGFFYVVIAEQLGVTRQTVAKWEANETLPDIMSCFELSKIFSVTMEMLMFTDFTNSGTENPDEKDGKYIFGISKVGERGQIVIPKKARSVFEIETGDRLLILGDKAKGMAIVKLGSIPNFD